MSAPSSGGLSSSNEAERLSRPSLSRRSHGASRLAEAELGQQGVGATGLLYSVEIGEKAQILPAGQVQVKPGRLRQHAGHAAYRVTIYPGIVPGHADLPCIGVDHTVKEANSGRLAGSVGTNKAHDFATVNAETQVGQHRLSGETLCNVIQFQEGFLCHVHHPPV